MMMMPMMMVITQREENEFKINIKFQSEFISAGDNDSSSIIQEWLVSLE